MTGTVEGGRAHAAGRYLEAATPTEIERLVVAMAREVDPGDVAVVGIGTPVALAALLLARELHAPDLSIMMPGALDPTDRTLSSFLADPVAAAARSRARLSRVDILEAIEGRRITLQFVRPAQVDAHLRINTDLLRTPAGPRLLVGPVALPDVAALVRRVVAYLPRHRPEALVEAVDTVTAPRESGCITAVLTPLARIEHGGDGPVLSRRAAGVSVAELLALTGFRLDTRGCRPMAEPTADELQLLRGVIDPDGLTRVEAPGGRRLAAHTLANLWTSGGVT